MNATYDILFQINFWHDYFFNLPDVPLEAPTEEYDFQEFLAVKPTQQTLQFLPKCRFLYKLSPIGLTLISELNPLDLTQTLFNLTKRLKFTFILTPTDPNFFNYTNLPLSTERNGLYYFNNLTDNELIIGPNSYLFLSAPLEAFNAATTYQIGDLVRDGATIYEVVQVPVTGPPSPFSSEWSDATNRNSEYVSGLDRVTKASQFLTFQGPNSDPGGPAVFQVSNVFGEVVPLGNKTIPGEEIPIEETVFPTDPAEDLMYQLDIRNLEEGFYTLELDGAGIVDQFYKLNTTEIDSAFGVIEIFHTPPSTSPISVTPNYAFIDSGPDPINPISTVDAKTYVLALKNRLTFWRYFNQSDLNTPVFEESDPRPLSNFYESISFGGTLLPNPNGQFINRELAADGTTTRLLSNIYLQSQ